MAAEVAKLVAYFGADTNDFKRGIGEVRAGLGDAQGGFLNFKTVALGVTTAVGAGMVALAAKATDLAVEWDAAMHNVMAAAGRSADEQSKWSQQVLSLGMNAVEGPQAVAMAYSDVVSAVQDADKHLAILQAGIRLDEAGDQTTELAVTTDGLINAINAYNASADDAAKFSDIYARAVQVGKGTMGEFVAAISPGLGLMNQMSISFEEVGASIAFMTTRGQSASMAMTKLENIATALIKPNAELEDVMKKLGITSFQTGIQQDGLRQTLLNLYDALGQDDQAMAKVLGSSEALQGAFLLMDETAGGFFDTFNEGIEGATDEQRQAQLEATANKFALIQAKAEGLGIALASKLTPEMNTFLDVTAAGLDFVADLIGVSADEAMAIEVPDPYAEAREVHVPTTVTYEIQAGDTLWGIAAQNNTTVEAIMAANPQITNAGMIFAGDTLTIPVSGAFQYRIVEGDTLWSIAAQNNTTVEAILAANPGLTAAGALVEGQTVTIPATGNFNFAIDGVTVTSNVDWNAALGDVMFTQEDLQMFAEQERQLNESSDGIGKAVSDLIDDLNKIDGIEIDREGLGRKLAGVNEELGEFNRGLGGAVTSLGIELPNMREVWDNFWETSFLNPQSFIDLVNDIGELPDEISQTVDDLQAAIDGLPSFRESWDSFWSTSFLNPDALFDLIDDIAGAIPGLDGVIDDLEDTLGPLADAWGELKGLAGDISEGVTDIVNAGADLMGLGEDEKPAIPVTFVADESSFLTEDSLYNYFGEITYPIMFQPTDELEPGQELFGIGAQVDFETMQAEMDAAGLEAKVVTVMVDENGVPIGDSSLTALGVTPEEAATMPIVIVPVDRDGNPIEGVSVPDYILGQAEGMPSMEVPVDQTAGAQVSLDVEQAYEYANAVDGIIAAAEDPITIDIADSSFIEIDNAAKRINDMATDRSMTLTVNLQMGVGRELLAFFGGGGGTGVEARAEGGPVHAYQPYIVGEKGPELFVPGNGGRIIPNSDLNSGNMVNILGGMFTFNGIQDLERFYDTMQEVGKNRGG